MKPLTIPAPHNFAPYEEVALREILLAAAADRYATAAGIFHAYHGAAPPEGKSRPYASVYTIMPRAVKKAAKLGIAVRGRRKRGWTVKDEESFNRLATLFGVNN